MRVFLFYARPHPPTLLAPAPPHRLDLGPAKREDSDHRPRTLYLGRGGTVPFEGVDVCGSDSERGWSSYSRRRRTRGSQAYGRDKYRCGDPESLHLRRDMPRALVHFPRHLYLHLCPRYGWQATTVRRKIWMAQRYSTTKMNATPMSQTVLL